VVGPNSQAIRIDFAGIVVSRFSEVGGIRPVLCSSLRRLTYRRLHFIHRGVQRKVSVTATNPDGTS
jgi:hypothetical protein